MRCLNTDFIYHTVTCLNAVILFC